MAGLVGNIKLFISPQVLDRTVTESAMIAAAEWGVWVGGEAFAVAQKGSAALVL